MEFSPQNTVKTNHQLEENTSKINKQKIREKKMMKKKMMKIASCVVIGNTGTGKSTLGNAMTNRKQFTTSGKCKSETKETSEAYGFFGNQAVHVIDTPGFQDSSGNDQEHLNEMTAFIRENEGVQAFVLVFNFVHPRIDRTIVNLIEMVNSMYKGKKVFEHVAVVWTHYFEYLSQDVKNTTNDKREEFKEHVREITHSEVTEEELECIPHYFVDCDETKSLNTETQESLRELISWIGDLPRMVDNVGIIQDVDVEIRSEEKEEGSRFVFQEQHLNVVTRHFIKQQRMRQLWYSGRETYTEWEDIAGSEFYEEEVMEAEPIGRPMIETRKRTVKDGQVVKNAHKVTHTFHSANYHGDLYTKYKELVEECEHQPMTDGTIVDGEWRVVSERKYDVYSRHVIRDTMRELEMLNK